MRKLHLPGMCSRKLQKYDRHTRATAPTIQMTELVDNMHVVHKNFKLKNRPIKSVNHNSLDRSVKSRPANLLCNSQIHQSKIDTYVNIILTISL